MDIRKSINKQRQRRRFHNRNRMRLESNRPRLSINRSLTGFSCQVIDDKTGKTLASASTNEKSLREQFKYGGNCEAATKLGEILAERAKSVGVEAVAFDRGHCRYHGRVAAFADAVRNGGITI
jgi:large subunit ribosomal protein L18